MNGKLKKLIFAFALFPAVQLFPYSHQINIYSQESELVRVFNSYFLLAGNYGTNIQMRVNTGENWRDVIIDISGYVYGTAKLKNLNLTGQEYFSEEKNLNLLLRKYGHIPNLDFSNPAIPAVFNPLLDNSFPESSSSAKTEQNIRSKGIFTEGLNTAVKMNFIVKVTKTITLHFKTANGKRSLSISRGKVVRSFYKIKVKSPEEKKNFYCYKLKIDETPAVSWTIYEKG